MNRWIEHTAPRKPGDYPVQTEGGRTDMLRHWNGSAWSAPWYADDPAEIVERARSRTMEPPMPGETNRVVWTAQVEVLA